MNNHFRKFNASIIDFSLPEKFTFPFYYEPHPLSVLAAKELQEYLETQTDFDHNFGIDKTKMSLVIGKMFGVLVVQNETGELGYLSAFSGKLAESNHHERFVPPVFDMLTENSFFNQGMKILNPMNRQIEDLENAADFEAAKALLKTEKSGAETKISEAKAVAKSAKKIRKEKRTKGEIELSTEDFEALKEELSKESVYQNYLVKDLVKYWKSRVEVAENQLSKYTDEIENLKEIRRQTSANLQQQLFDNYKFLNQEKKEKSLADIFKEVIPPAGSGECAAPKLLQYAFLHGLKPIAMAEFWWGESPKSEVRTHGNFYPACRGKCKPILGHMLEGIETDPNPMLENTAFGQVLETIYEDDAIVIINKPAEFLSVPGKNVQDSVQFRLQLKYPDATGPLTVHRLDMSTSGLMLIAKTKEYHEFLQRQFIKRKVKKRYTALLDGIVEGDEGLIDLPLRVDLDDRPRQLVCYEHGKNAVTKWKVIERKNACPETSVGKTLVHFFPITGRTHQLRVHSAHPLGLNMPIVGDDLYGKKANRLHLHAAFIEFMHPTSRQIVKFELEADF
jgi:tRNA pseudouridine32 synthase/23S rRNA pseudouridine746 synthase